MRLGKGNQEDNQGIRQVFAVLTTTARPPIIYDYGTTDNVGTQLAAFINTPLTEPDLGAVQAALGSLGNLIQDADAAYAAANILLTNVTTSQTNVSGAYVEGVKTGEAVLEAALPDDPAPQATATIAPLNTATTTVETAATGLNTPSTALNTALPAIVDTTTANAVVTAATALNTAAQSVVAAANNRGGCCQ